MSKVIHIQNIQAKTRTRGGQKIPGAIAEGQHASVTVGYAIVLHGVDKNVAPGSDGRYSTTFKIGDLAEYGSYNLSYLGHIIAITEKTVTIREEHSQQIHRLDLYTFNWRNKRFNLEQIRRENAETSQCI